MTEELRARLNALPRKAEWEIMQDLLDSGAIRPECVAEFSARIAQLQIKGNEPCLNIANRGWITRDPEGAVTHEGLETLEDAVDQIRHDTDPVKVFEHRIEYREKGTERWFIYCTIVHPMTVEMATEQIKTWNEISAHEYRMARRPVAEWEPVE